MPGAGDVWSITTCLGHATHVLPNNQTFTWAVIATSDYGGVSELHAAWQAALPNVMNLMVTDVEAIGAFYRRVLPTPQSAIGVKFTTPIPGALISNPLPLACAALVLRQSGFAGRNVNGRLYLPWLPIQYMHASTPNLIVPVYREAIQAGCKALDDALQAGGSGSNWRSVVISSRSTATPGVYATPVSSWWCQPFFRNLPQRARRDYRCPFEDSWLAIPFPGSFARRRSVGGSWTNSGSNPLGWRYWLNNGARGGDDGTPDPTWKLPTFAGTTWHTLSAFVAPGSRWCPAVNGPGGIVWPAQFPNANAHDPPAFELVAGWHYSKIAPAVPNDTDHWLNAGELDYYRCRFKVTNVPLVRSAILHINQIDGVAHYVNGVEVWNNLGNADYSAPGCIAGVDIDVLEHLIFDNALNCWGVIHQPQGVLGTSKHRWDRYPERRPPDYDEFDSWWAGELRIGGTTE